MSRFLYLAVKSIHSLDLSVWLECKLAELYVALLVDSTRAFAVVVEEVPLAVELEN